MACLNRSGGAPKTSSFCEARSMPYLFFAMAWITIQLLSTGPPAIPIRFPSKSLRLLIVLLGPTMRLPTAFEYGVNWYALPSLRWLATQIQSVTMTSTASFWIERVDACFPATSTTTRLNPFFLSSSRRLMVCSSHLTVPNFKAASFKSGKVLATLDAA